MASTHDTGKHTESWDNGSHREFFTYYAIQSESEATVARFRGTLDAVLRVAAKSGLELPLDVADIGCGAGAQSCMWAELGHRVHGIDVNEPLIELAKKRGKEKNVEVHFEVGTATALPWANGSMDVCLLPELLEHVRDWRSCVCEAARVLRPGGLLYMSTTNVLCPKQQEFNLPLYSWYPRPLKRYCERLATTTRPALANYAKYPAVNWFSYYGLRDALDKLGFLCLDRFDLINLEGKGVTAAFVVALMRRLPLLRFFGHIATPYTSLLAVKSGVSRMNPHGRDPKDRLLSGCARR